MYFCSLFQNDRWSKPLSIGDPVMMCYHPRHPYRPKGDQTLDVYSHIKQTRLRDLL